MCEVAEKQAEWDGKRKRSEGDRAKSKQEERAREMWDLGIAGWSDSVVCVTNSGETRIRTGVRTRVPRMAFGFWPGIED